jgi:hypothetical protein
VMGYLKPRFTEGDPMGFEYYLEFRTEFYTMLEAIVVFQSTPFSFTAVAKLNTAILIVTEILAHHFGGAPSDYCVDPA